MPNEQPLWETEHWRVFLHADQTYLGRCVATAKRRPLERLPDMSDEEWLDLSHNVITPFEAAVRAAFGAELFNWSCLMNNAYQENPPAPHVHWHVKPRYRNPVTIGNETFVDEHFGHHYLFGVERTAPDAVRQEIIKNIRSAYYATRNTRH